MEIVRRMWEFQTYERFSRLSCPALALPALPAEPLSSMDREYLERKRAGAEKVLAANPHVRLHWMKDAIHDIPLQKPQALVELILEFERALPA
jgi:pimeloyl-ACP methyl ester carboxylesterase